MIEKKVSNKVVALEPRKRVGKPVDMAETAIYLSSIVGGFVAGFSRQVDGDLIQMQGQTR